MENRKINVLKLTAGNTVIIEASRIEDELEVYQKFVDGCIECVRINERLVMVVNDEGLIRELPENIIASCLYWSITGKPVTPPICGNAILVGYRPEDGSFGNIPPAAVFSVLDLSRKLRYIEAAEDPGAQPE